MFRTLVLSTLTLLALLALPACYFGNYTQNQPGPDQFDGYYETLVSGSIQMCAQWTVGNGTSQLCQTVPATHMDPILSNDILANPVYLNYDDTNEIFWLGPYDPSNNPLDHIPLQNTPSTNNLYWNGQISIGITPMPDTHSDCMLVISANVADGSYTNSGPFSSGATVPLQGRIIMNMAWTYTPVEQTAGKTDCTFIGPCYNATAGACDAQDEANVQGIFGDFVTVGAITAANLNTLSYIQYNASYQ